MIGGYNSYRKANIYNTSKLLLHANCDNLEECEDLYYDLEDLQYNCDDVFRVKEQKLKSGTKSYAEEKSDTKSYTEDKSESKPQEYQIKGTICNELLLKRIEINKKIRLKGGSKSKKKNKKKKKKQRKRKTFKNK